MNLKKSILLTIFIGIIFGACFFAIKWFNKSTADEVSSIKASLNNSVKSQVTPTACEPDSAISAAPAEKTAAVSLSDISAKPTSDSNDNLSKKVSEVYPKISPTVASTNTNDTTAAAPVPSQNPTSVPTAVSSPTPAKAEETEVVDTMHKMSNGLIIAEDGMIWGIIDMTKNKVSELIKTVDESSFKNKSTLLQILERWSSGDFSQIVGDHNTLWEYLNGNIGRAKSPNSKIVDGKYPDFK